MKSEEMRQNILQHLLLTANLRVLLVIATTFPSGSVFVVRARSLLQSACLDNCDSFAYRLKNSMKPPMIMHDGDIGKFGDAYTPVGEKLGLIGVSAFTCPYQGIHYSVDRAREYINNRGDR